VEAARVQARQLQRPVAWRPTSVCGLPPVEQAARPVAASTGRRLPPRRWLERARRRARSWQQAWRQRPKAWWPTSGYGRPQVEREVRSEAVSTALPSRR